MSRLKDKEVSGSRLLTPTIRPASKYWIAGVMVLFLISPTDIGLFERLAVLVIYGLFFAYPLTYKLWSRGAPKQFIAYQSPTMPILLGLLIVQLVGVSISTQYYTGSNILTAYGNALSGVNSYADYQRHFAERAIANASLISKAVYILLLAISKLVTIFLIANFFLSAKRTPVSALALLLATSIYLGFGLARGTFFEVFELAAAFAFFWSMTSNVQALTGRIRQSKIFRLVLIIAPLALILLFVVNALRRYDDASAFFSQCSPNFCYSSYGLPFPVEYPVYLLTVYFGNGAYFMAKLYEATVFHGEWSYLLPLQAILDDSGSDFGVRNFMCGTYVQCRFVWTPEMATLISVFGLAALPLINWIFHVSQKFETWAFRTPDVTKMLTLYFIFLFLLSLPVANFLLVSSSSIVALMILLGLIVLIAPTRSASRGRKAGATSVVQKGI
jgi:hypothetical protein